MSNNPNFAQSDTRPSSLAELMENVQVAWRLFRDNRMDLYLRYGIPAMVAAYVLLPIDLVPDLIPGFGQLDDIAVIWLGLRFFLNLAPEDIVAEHRSQVRGQEPASSKASAQPEADVVDGDFRVVE